MIFGDPDTERAIVQLSVRIATVTLGLSSACLLTSSDNPHARAQGRERLRASTEALSAALRASMVPDVRKKLDDGARLAERYPDAAASLAALRRELDALEEQLVLAAEALDTAG